MLKLTRRRGHATFGETAGVVLECSCRNDDFYRIDEGWKGLAIALQEKIFEARKQRFSVHPDVLIMQMFIPVKNYTCKLLLTKILALVFALNFLTADSLTREELADAVRESLEHDLLEAWYPRVIDREAGGYLSHFDADWKPVDPQHKMIVTQARHVWTTSRLAEMFPEKTFLPRLSEHGVAFLQARMWDDENGGFRWLVNRHGKTIEDTRTGLLKQSYGIAFGIYALAAHADRTGDKSALDLAKAAFHWLETHAHDDEYGGYYRLLHPDGRAIKTRQQFQFSKGQNSSIHLLEAFTELYHVWEDPLLRERLIEMRDLIKHRMLDERGFVYQFFYRDWTPFRLEDPEAIHDPRLQFYDHVSFGHDVEIAYLLLEAEAALGHPDDGETLMLGKRLLDHALQYGWDHGNGGIYDGGMYLGNRCEIIMSDKSWWAQAEMLNTLLIMADFFPDDPNDYWQKTLKQWNYIQTYLIDSERGGWYEEGKDQNPDVVDFPKAHQWKGAYHDSRALMNVWKRLSAEEQGVLNE